MKQPGWGVLAGALGAAATGVVVGVAAKQRAKIAADRRRLATQLSETSEAPRGEPCSVMADDDTGGRRPERAGEHAPAGLLHEAAPV